VAPSAAVRSIIRLARAAPPEFAADVLIKLVELDLVPDFTTRCDLLKEAFRIAVGAQGKVGQRWIRSAGPFASVARLQGLDHVSLRSRAVRGLLKVDPQAAVAFFDDIDLPLEPLSDCSQPYVYDLTLYYQVMTELLSSVPDRDKVYSLLRRHSLRFRSAAQVQPLVAVFLNLKGHQESVFEHVLHFAQQLPTLDRDPPVFSACFQGAITALARLALKSPEGWRPNIVYQARAWVLNNIGGRFCRPNSSTVITGGGGKPKISPVLWASPVDHFNGELAPLISGRRPIIDEKTLPTLSFGPPTNQPAYSANWTKLHRTYTLLANDDSKDTPRWTREMEGYVAELVAWEGAGDQGAYYLEKCALLREAADVLIDAPSSATAQEGIGTLRSVNAAHGVDRLRLAIVKWLDSPCARAVYDRRHLTWYAPVDELLRDYKSQHGAALANLLSQSGNGVLRLYGNLASLLANSGR
jgi:hypothetical protein